VTSGKRPRLLFDENFGKPGVESLAKLVAEMPGAPAIEVRHLLELFPPGTSDEVWIPAVAHEDYILITSDRHRTRGRQATRGQPLPRLCVEHGIRHVLLSGTLAQDKVADRVLAVLSEIHRIAAIANDPPGSRYGLDKVGPGRGRLKRKEVPKRDAGPKSQRSVPFPIKSPKPKRSDTDPPASD
jgi:hypothetical protein